MKVSDFDYHLPADRIAHAPAEPRDSARLLVAEAGQPRAEHVHVLDLPDRLRPGDLLIVNDTRVRHARLLGRRKTGGAVELLLVDREPGGAWRTLAQPAGRLVAGEELELEAGALIARMRERPARADGSGPGEWRVEILDANTRQPADDALLERYGRAPLPPYIEREPRDEPGRDRERYQTLFARSLGAIAAPTAGLHFTPRLVARLRDRSIDVATVTLHVGEGTFRSVEVEDTRDHRMHVERFDLPEATARAITSCRERGGRVVAVGTTSTRVLEHRARDDGTVEPGAGETALFIQPSFRFRVVDALLTNFHLPRSTLLMLVSAFAGRELVLELYREAVDRGYRFYSYGDAMLLMGSRR